MVHKIVLIKNLVKHIIDTFVVGDKQVTKEEFFKLWNIFEYFYTPDVSIIPNKGLILITYSVDLFSDIGYITKSCKEENLTLDCSKLDSSTNSFDLSIVYADKEKTQIKTIKFKISVKV